MTLADQPAISPVTSASVKPASVLEKPVMKSVEKGITIALFAPNNEDVQLIAGWRNWEPLKLTKDADGWWRHQVDLPDGEHRYRFRVKSKSFFAVDKYIDIADPYAFQVSDDEFENAIIQVRNNERVWVDYEYKHDDVPLPTNDRLVIYELHVGDFTGTKDKAGTFNQLVDKLDYLAGLGINCIELLPVKEFPGRSWGYSLKSLFGVENTYGTPNELCRLVDECHARGIRVILDGVYNHAHADCALAQIDYAYWFFETNPDGKDCDWGPKYNYMYFDEKLNVFPARKYVKESISHWIEKFHIDGIRFDATNAIRHFDVMKEITDMCYEKVGGAKPFICIAEHVAEDPAITGRDRGAPMDAAWGDGLGRFLQGLISHTSQCGMDPEDVEKLMTFLDPAKNGYGEAHRLVTFVGNHDFKRPMMFIGEDGHIFGEAAFRRCKLGTAIILAAPGLPMVWMGTEFGFATEKSLEPRPLDWSLLNNKENADLLEFHRKLFDLRRNSDALDGGSFEPLIVDGERKIIAFNRWSEGGDVVVFMANTKDEDAGGVSITGKGLEDGTWRDYLNEIDIEVTGGELVTTLGPSEVKLFRKVAAAK